MSENTGFIILKQLRPAAAVCLLAAMLFLPALAQAWTVTYQLSSPDGQTTAEALEPGATLTLNVNLDITLETGDTAFATSAATVVIGLNSGHNLTLSPTQPTSVASASLAGDVLTLSFTESTTPEDTAGLNQTSLSCGPDPVTTRCSEALLLASVAFTVGEAAAINTDETKMFSINAARVESLTDSSSMPTTKIAAENLGPSSQNTADTAMVLVRRDVDLVVVTRPTLATPAYYDGRQITLSGIRVEARNEGESSARMAFTENLQVSVSCSNCATANFVSASPAAFVGGVFNGSITLDLTLTNANTAGTFNLDLDTANTEAVTLLTSAAALRSSEPNEIRNSGSLIQNSRVNIQTPVTYTFNGELLRPDDTRATDPQRTTVDSLAVELVCSDCMTPETRILTPNAYSNGVIDNFRVEVTVDSLQNNLRQTTFSLNLLVNMSGGLVSRLMTGIATGTVNGDVTSPTAATLAVAASTDTLTADFSFGASTDQLDPGGMNLPLSTANGGEFALFYQRIGERNRGLSCPENAQSIVTDGTSLALTSVAEDGTGSPRSLTALTPNSFYCAVLQVTDPVDLSDLSNVVGFDSAIRATRLVRVSSPVSSVPSSVGRNSSRALISHRPSTLNGFVIHAVNDTGEIQRNFNVTGNLVLPYTCLNCSNISSVGGTVLTFRNGILANRNIILEPELDDLAITDRTYSLTLMAAGHFGTLSVSLVDAAPVIGDITPPEVTQDLSAVAIATSVTLSFGETTDRQIPSDTPTVLNTSGDLFSGSFTIYYSLIGERSTSAPNPQCSQTAMQLRTGGTAVVVQQVGSGNTSVPINHSTQTPIQPNRNYCAVLAVVDPGDFERFSNVITFNTHVRATRLTIEERPTVRNIVSGRTSMVGAFVVRGRNNANEEDTFLSEDVMVSAFCSNCVSSPTVTITPNRFTDGLLDAANLQLTSELIDLAVFGLYSVRLEVPGFFGTLRATLVEDEELTGDTEPAVPPQNLAAAVEGPYRVEISFGGTTDMQIATDAPFPLTTERDDVEFRLFYVQNSNCPPAEAIAASGYNMPVTAVTASGATIDLIHSNANTPLRAATAYCIVLRVIDPGDFETYSNVIGFTTAEYSPADNSGNGIPDHLDQIDAGINSVAEYFTTVLNCPADEIGICDSAINGGPNGVPESLELYYGRAGDVAFNTSRTVWACQAEGTLSRVSAARQNLVCGGAELADLSGLLLHSEHLALTAGGITSPTMLGARQLPSGTYWFSNRDDDNRVVVTRLDLYPQAKLSLARHDSSEGVVQISSLGPAPDAGQQIFTLRSGLLFFGLSVNTKTPNATTVRGIDGLTSTSTAVLEWINPAGSVRRQNSFPAHYGVYLALESGQSVVSAGTTVRISVDQNRNSLLADTPLLVNGNACASLANTRSQVVNCRLPSDLSAGSVAIFSVSLVSTNNTAVASVLGATSVLIGDATEGAPTDSDSNRLPDEVDGAEVGNYEVLSFALGQGMARTAGYLRVSPGVRVRAGTAALANYLAGTVLNLDDTDYGINVAGLRDNPADMMLPQRDGSLDLNFEFRCHGGDPNCLTDSPTIVLYAPESANGFSFMLNPTDANTQGISCPLPLPATPPTGCELEGVSISFAATVTENICPAFDNEEAWSETATAPTGGTQLPCIRLTAPVDPLTGFYTSVARVGVLGGAIDPFAGSSGGGGGAIGIHSTLVLLLLMLFALAAKTVSRSRPTLLLLPLALLGAAPASALVSLDDLTDIRLDKLSAGIEYLYVNYDREGGSLNQRQVDDDDAGYRLSASWDIDGERNSGLAIDVFYADYGEGDICAGESSSCSQPISTELDGTGIGLSWHFPLTSLGLLQDTDGSLYLGVGHRRLEADASSGDELTDDSDSGTYFEVGVIWDDLSWFGLNSEHWSAKFSYQYLDDAGIDFYSVGLVYHFGEAGSRPRQSRRSSPRQRPAAAKPQPQATVARSPSVERQPPRRAEAPQRARRSIASTAGSHCRDWNSCRCQVPLSGSPRGWYVQVAAYYRDDVKRIEGLKQSLRDTGYRRVGSVNRSGSRGMLTLIRVAGAASCSEAQRIKRRIDRQYKVDSAVRPYQQTPW